MFVFSSDSCYFGFFFFKVCGCKERWGLCVNEDLDRLLRYLLYSVLSSAMPSLKQRVDSSSLML